MTAGSLLYLVTYLTILTTQSASLQMTMSYTDPQELQKDLDELTC